MLLIHKQILYKIVLLLICTFIANISIANTTEEIKAYALFGQEGMPSAQDLNSIGSYSKGCLAGAKKITGNWKILASYAIIKKSQLGPSKYLKICRAAQFFRELSKWMARIIYW